MSTLGFGKQIPSIGTQLKLIRFEKNLKQLEVAAKVDCSASYLSGIEHDKRFPSFSLLNRLMTLYDTEIIVMKKNNYAELLDLKVEIEYILQLLNPL